mgnify:FL=1
MNELVIEMWHAGFNVNQIAARYGIHKHVVEGIITNPSTPVKKKRVAGANKK